MYTITVSRDSRFYWLFNAWLKAYAFSWSFEPTNVCRAVWGTLFWPVGFLFRAVRFVGIFTLIFAAFVVLDVIWDRGWLAVLVMGIFAVLSFSVHRARADLSKLSPEERERKEAENKARSKEDLKKLEDWGERMRTRLREFPEDHPFVAALVATPFLIVWNLLRLTGILVAPIAIPFGMHIALPVMDWCFDAGEELMWIIRSRPKRARGSQPSALGEAYQSFHDRTCRKIVVE